MRVLVPVVEGDGEVQAVPILLRKIFADLQEFAWEVARPKNAHGCGNITKENGIERFVELACSEQGCAGVLVLMDSDGKACPSQLAKELAQRVRAGYIRHPVAIVVAHHEFETWFLASFASIVGKKFGGHQGLKSNLVPPADCEDVSNAKGWINRQFPNGWAYRETVDQPAMTSLIDCQTAQSRSRSFDRLRTAVIQLRKAAQSRKLIVTP